VEIACESPVLTIFWGSFSRTQDPGPQHSEILTFNYRYMNPRVKLRCPKKNHWTFFLMVATSVQVPYLYCTRTGASRMGFCVKSPGGLPLVSFVAQLMHVWLCCARATRGESVDLRVPVFFYVKTTNHPPPFASNIYTFISC